MTSVITPVINGGGSNSGVDASAIPYAFIYKTNNTPETTSLTINTPIKVVATTTRDTANSSSHWTMPSSNRITYTGDSHLALIILNISGDANTGGGEYKMRLYKNGAAVNSVVYGVALHTSTNRPLPYSVAMLVNVASGDYFEIWTEEVIGGVSFLTESASLQSHFVGWL